MKQPLPAGVRSEVAGPDRCGGVARPPPEPRLPTQRIGGPIGVGSRADERNASSLESDGQELAWIVIDEDHGVLTDPDCGGGTTHRIGFGTPGDLDGNEIVES